MTDSKKPEGDVEGQSALIISLLDSIPDLIFFKDTNGVYRGCNPPFAEFVGYSRQAIIGKTDYDLFDQDIANALCEHDQGLLDSQTVRRSEEWITYPDGRCILVDTLKTPYWGPTGELIGLIGISRDITERKRAEEALREMNVTLEQQAAVKEQLAVQAQTASVAKSAFLANMSHEIRTPINAILGFSQLMQSDPVLTPTQSEHLRAIIRAGDQLLALINNILEISKIEAGKTTLNPWNFDLLALLDDLAASFQAQTMARGLTLRIEPAPELLRHVCADENKIRQILLNLLNNAVKFTPKGSITLRVANQWQEDRTMRLLLEVEDTGVGIAPEKMAHLFETFERTADGRKHPGGIGLGLAISQRFARLMGGEITVRSTVNQGSVFRVELPIHPGDGADRPTPLEFNRPNRPETPASVALTPELLSDLPAELVAAMLSATRTGDITRLMELISIVERHHPALAENLGDLADRYDYDGLEKLLERGNQ